MPEPHVDETLDLSGVACPYNFVRALIKLAGMKTGAVLAVVIDDGEPYANVPPAIEEEGYRILARERAGAGWKLLVEKV
jgi:TusA-related sulfurtransferase